MANIINESYIVRYADNGKQRQRTFAKQEDAKKFAASYVGATIGEARKPWTVRYRDSFGKQREKSFGTQTEAKKFVTDQAVASRYGADVDLKASRSEFAAAVDRWVEVQPWRNERTKDNYLYAAKRIKAAYAGKSVRDAANTPDILRTVVNADMINLAKNTRSTVRAIVVGTLDMLVSEGTIQGHRCHGIKFAERTVTEAETEADGFVFITDDQVKTLAGRVGIAVWLQRTMGLRINEALGAEKSDFFMKNGQPTLRLMWQSSRDGKSRVPLKKRKAGQFRDVPVPMFVWNMIKDMPDGPLCPGQSTRYMTYIAVWGRFTRAMKALGIKGFTTHSLRHQFASESLENGMNIVDLAEVLGHADPSITLRTYVHAVPDAFQRTRAMMDARWSVKLSEAA